MKFMQEVTEWEYPGHIYVLNDSKDKMYGYIRRGTNIVETVKKPYRFSTSHRKFKEVPNIYGYVKPEEVPEGFVKVVLGSKGERYTITEVNGVHGCTCSGFKFRSNCKHLSK